MWGQFQPSPWSQVGLTQLAATVTALDNTFNKDDQVTATRGARAYCGDKICPPFMHPTGSLTRRVAFSSPSSCTF